MGTHFPPASLKKDYGHREDIPPRSKAPTDYGSRVVTERRLSSRDNYLTYGPIYFELLRSTSRTAPRRAYVNDGYGQRFESPPPLCYREGLAHNYETISRSKRLYGTIDDASS
ncbi:Heterogeneous nuclear ribonucleoprotein like [Quillaja saponaria]|uniref:Heterogeneous nuclear ribonucleoprotein like n=1 Tax=Quillaja saponaria TaxID=32244 RepID=A0AAD7Q7D0_QUISA|nr:Heterogeneous nuclear ribonucleoprotein like [Quillaja saponaria]